MKVLIVNRFMGIYGGAETVVKELAVNLNSLGIKNLVLTLNISEEVKKICKDLDVITPERMFPYKLRSTDLLSSIGIICEISHLRRLVRKHAKGFDLINVHNFPANWVTCGLRKPVVWMCNEMPDFYNNPHPSLAIRFFRSIGIQIDKFMVNRYINNICVADELNANRVFGRYKRRPEIVPYGIEYDFFSEGNKTEAIERYSIDKNSFLLLQVGMLSPEKNQLKSIQALEQLINRIPNIKLILAGKPQNPYESILKGYITKNNLQDHIFFAGHLTKKEVCNLYQACSIALFPVKSQGGWLAPFEALSAGKPIVVSSTMGAASIIQRENIGVVSDDLATAINNIYTNYAYHETVAQKGKLWVKNNLTWRNFTEKMLHIFQETINQQKRYEL